MFKRKKTTGVKKVIDVKFEVKQHAEEDKKNYFVRIMDFLKEPLKRERENMPMLDGINRISTYIKNYPRHHNLISLQER
ncbi:MAG: hypothetical protein JETT_2746 [Candidatus Jettenia ecosi]|uniref:Uncharacterized protein n=1 Tax=Candidatus Jettenia ecosi TaxID=2494326 RepID=A0A533QE63_9BACT|nr:MAG: hypothetical protein JETT_2746 [Candidatus Jettenia ecosi]